MVEISAENLSPELQIAVAHTPPAQRDALRIFLELDARLARIVGSTSEPILGQMRLAWWREMLGKPIAERPTGDAVLDGIGLHWQGRETALIQLVDGWEHMLAESFDATAALAFGQGRAAPFAEIGGNGVGKATGQRWALLDAALHVPPGPDRDILSGLAKEIDVTGPLPKALRGLTILDALVRRSIRRGIRPLMEGRSASLFIIRASIFGR